MAGKRLSVARYAARRRREEAAIARVEALLLRRLRRLGPLRTAREAERWLRVRLAGRLQEELHAVWLDGHHRIIECDLLAKGSIDRAAIDARVVVQSALLRNARAVILAHNHPSGVAQPSNEDIDFTAEVRAALALVGIALLAHYVIGEDTVVVADERPVTRSRRRIAAVADT